MNVRTYIKEDYPVAAGWWVAHGKPAVPEGALPMPGVVVENGDGAPLAMVWAYLCNSTGVAFLAWPVANPDNAPRDSYDALSHAVGFLEVHARELDYNFIFLASEGESVVHFMGNRGYLKSQEQVTILHKWL